MWGTDEERKKQREQQEKKLRENQERIRRNDEEKLERKIALKKQQQDEETRKKRQQEAQAGYNAFAAGIGGEKQKEDTSQNNRPSLANSAFGGGSGTGATNSSHRSDRGATKDQPSAGLIGKFIKF